MKHELICIVCPIGCSLTIDESNQVSGNQCPRGAAFAKKELTKPTRLVTTTVKIEGAVHERLPVVTSAEVDKALVKSVVQQMHSVCVSAPVKEGDVIFENVCDSGVNMIASREMPKR